MVNRSSARVSYHLRSYSLMHMHTLAFIPMKTNRRDKMCFYRISAIACAGSGGPEGLQNKYRLNKQFSSLASQEA